MANASVHATQMKIVTRTYFVTEDTTILSNWCLAVLDKASLGHTIASIPQILVGVDFIAILRV